MSPTTGAPGTIRHPDVSEISDLTEGLLSPSRSAEVRRHLTDCPLCEDVRASLEEIRGLLGTLPGPARMPADIAGRIDAALAAEALLDRTAPGARETRAGGDTTGAGGTEAADAAAPDVSRETPAATPGPRVPRTAPAGHAGGSTGPGRARVRARRRMAALGTLAAAAVCVLGIYLSGGFPASDSIHDTATKETARSAGSAQAAAPLGTFTEQGLPESVRQLLGTAAPKAEQPKAPEPKAEEPGEATTFGLEGTTPGLTAPEDRSAQSRGPGVPQCVRAGTGRAEPPLAAERGTFQGTEVYLLVLPHPGDPARVDAYVLDSTCENNPGTATGAPLLKGTYPRS
ncbi:hypothetical protein [Streptomyces sp. NPDC089799]|uniref:hypothetical protein n=1 Tax=Streptomyces sp. NPDC089799 TaxID=3155066 RepID=UPI003415C8A9